MPSDLSKLLGNRVREIRVRAGLTQAQLADRIDISHEFLSRLERGIKTPSLETAKRIAGALGVGMPELFEFDVVAGDEREELFAGLKSVLATAELETVKLIVEVGRTIANRGGM